MILSTVDFRKHLFYYLYVANTVCGCVSIAPAFFNSEVNEELTEMDFREYRVNDLAYDLGSNRVMIKWKPLTVSPTIATMFRKPYTVDFSIYSLDPQTNAHSFYRNLATDIPNTGSYEITLPSIDQPYMITALGVSVSQNSISEFLSDINNLNDGNQDKTLRESIDEITGYIDAVKNARKFIRNPVTFVKNTIKEGIAGTLYDAGKRLGCELFCALEPDNIGNEINQRLPSCPPTSNRARRDSQFTRENPFLEFFTAGSVGQCFAQSVFDRYILYV